MQFNEFPKIARLSRNITVTEKIDGTNAQIFIAGANEISIEGLPASDPEAQFQMKYALGFKDGWAIYAGSRTRWITPGKDDNHGFAGWVKANAEELFKLGPGQHFGEWWGQGIQRRYGLDHKRFSLFNTARWNEETKPKCCYVVPVLYEGIFDEISINDALQSLVDQGSSAAPGFMEAEGVVIWHEAARQLFKKTIKNDESPKGLVK